MTEDPIKLFVVVMSILLAVLGFVAYKAYGQAAEYESALETLEGDAKRMRELEAEVENLTKQLSTGAKKGYLTVIQNAANANGVRLSRRNKIRDKGIGARGLEKRFRVMITRDRTASPITREKAAKFCRDVEKYSGYVLRTIELSLNRATGRGGAGKAGSDDIVTDDLYRVTVIFGYRTIK